MTQLNMATKCISTSKEQVTQFLQLTLALESIDGDPCYPCLAALPTVPDAVSVVVPPKITEQVISDCIDLGINKVWMQPGSESVEAIRHGEEHGIAVIHNRCVLIHTQAK